MMRIKSRFVVFCFLLLCGLLLKTFVHAFDFWVNKSTNAIVGSSGTCLANSRAGDMLGSILINKPSASSGTLIVYDSSATAFPSSIIGSIDVSTGATGGIAFTPRQYQYNLRVSSGITFTLQGIGSPDVTILWQSMRAN